MRITGNKPLSGVKGSGAKKQASSGSTSFSPDFGSPEESALPSNLAGNTGIQGMDALLALQEVDETSERRKKAARRGHSLLDYLEEVKIDLLAGHVSEEKLENLAKTVKERQTSGDTQIDTVLDEIELRVKVELAKLGRFSEE